MDDTSTTPRRHETRGVGLATLTGLIACLLLAPGLARAQQIGGTVTDTTGAVLPGVTVEARSPAIIEQVRTAVTDGAGQYLIVALEPGTYTVTYTLPGFNTFVREGIELTSGFTASINVQLLVGDIEETVTVSGASPVVDIQNVEQRQVMNREVIDSIPTGKRISSYGLLIPGMVASTTVGSPITQDAGGLALQDRQRMSIHGGRDDDEVLTLNMMEVGDITHRAELAYLPDTNFEEVSYSYSGNSAEHESGGVSINMIPRQGANSFSGSLFTTATFPGWIADNRDQDLIDRGLENATAIDEVWSINPSFGGPIVRDRVWFFLAHASTRANLQQSGVFFAVDPAAFVYEPDLTRPSVDLNTAREQSLNLTMQVTSKDKVKAYWSNSSTDRPYTLQGSVLRSLFITPEAALGLETRPNTYQLTWTRPHTNRLLFEAGVSHLPMRDDNVPTEGSVPTLPGILEVAPLLAYRNASGYLSATSTEDSRSVNYYRGSISYVTGSHNLKFGVTLLQQTHGLLAIHEGDWQSFLTLLGRPFRATFYGPDSQINEVASRGIYAQEQWTRDRLTVNAGLRWEYAASSYPDEVRSTNIWVRSPFAVTGQTVVGWKDFQPRLGTAYDLRGDGRTALKFSASRYARRNSTSWAKTINPVAVNNTMNRSWFDGATGHPFLGIPDGSLPSCIGPVACISGDGLVQGDPLNDAPNGEIISPNVTPAFGLPQITTFFDPDWAFGWGTRESNWEFSGGIQQELVSGVSLDVAYFRRVWINRIVVDDRALGAADFEVATASIPTDSRLPGGGGGTLSFYDLRPGPVPVPDALTTSAGNFGGQSETWNGFDITVDARVENLLLQGGVSTGRVSHDYCDVVSQVPESAATRLGRGEGDTDPLEYCNRSENWLTQVKFLGSYTLPYDIQLAATLQNQPGPERQALAQLTAADTDLGRPLVLYPSAVQLNLVEPGSLYGERFNQVDFRVTKILTPGGTARFRVMFDLFNVFNANAVTIEESGFGPEWLAPVNIMPGRMAKLAFQVDF